MELTHEETVLISSLLGQTTGKIGCSAYKKFQHYIESVGLTDEDMENIVGLSVICVNHDKIKKFCEKNINSSTPQENNVISRRV